MPITQTRMLRVLDAATHISNCFEQLRDTVRLELEKISRAPEATAESLAIIATAVEVLAIDPHKLTDILVEAKYFQRVKASNERQKRAQEKRRLRKRGETPPERPFNPGGIANKFLSNNPLERALQTAAPGEFEAFLRGDLSPPEAVSPDDVISLATPEGVKHTISVDKATGDTVERKVTFAEGEDASGTPLSGLSPDALESGESIL